MVKSVGGEQRGMVKCVCRNRWDWSSASAGLGRTGRKCLRDWAGLGRTGQNVFRSSTLSIAVQVVIPSWNYRSFMSSPISINLKLRQQASKEIKINFS